MCNGLRDKVLMVLWERSPPSPQACWELVSSICQNEECRCAAAPAIHFCCWVPFVLLELLPPWAVFPVVQRKPGAPRELPQGYMVLYLLTCRLFTSGNPVLGMRNILIEQIL